MVLQIFAYKKVLFPFFYTIEVCGNGFSQIIVTTSVFMTLLLLGLCNKQGKCLNSKTRFSWFRFFTFDSCIDVETVKIEGKNT